MANQYDAMGNYLPQYAPGGNRTDNYDYFEDTGNQWGGALGGAGAGALSGAALGSVVPGVGTLIGGVAGGLIGGLAGWAQGGDADKAHRLAKARAAQAAAQRAAVEKNWNDLLSQNQGYIDKNQIYDAQGNKLESNQFWTGLRSKESDIRSKFDAQQHGLSGVLAGRGMLGSGQELASRSALAGGQARNLADFSTGQIDRQQDIVRGLEQQQNALKQAQAASSQNLYGVDVGQAGLAQRQAQQSTAAMWENIGDLAVSGGKGLGGLAPQSPPGGSTGLNVSMDTGIASPDLTPINFGPTGGLASTPVASWPGLPSSPPGASAPTSQPAALPGPGSAFTVKPWSPYGPNSADLGYGGWRK